ncbi:MAG: hypothetical protein IH991_19685 [Planctomycetes bacterium]|nr:hypothetical protein [Planctomycetota bacterium]
MATPARNTPALQARVNVPNRPGSNLTIHGKTYATTPSGHEFSSSTDRTIAVLRPHKIVAKPEILRVSSKTGAFQSKLELSIPDANDLALRFSASFASKPASLRILSSESKDNTLTIRFEAVRPGTYRGNLVVRADARVPVPALNLPYEFDIKPKYFGLAVTTQALDLKSVKSYSGAIRLATLTIPTPDETPLTYSLTVSDLSNGKAIIPVSADVRTVAPAKGRPAKIVLTVDIPDVPAGLYTARVLFAMRGSAQSGNFEQPFQVTVVDSLTIQPIDFGLLEPGSVRKQSLLISNDGRQDIHNLQLTTSDVAAKGGLVEVTAPTTVPIVKAANQTSVDVQVAVSPLVTSRGDHQGVLEVRRPNGTVSRIPVRLKIVDKGKGRSELIVSPDQVRLTAKPGEVVRFQLSVKLSSDGPDSDKLTLSSTVLTGPDNAPTNTRAEFRSNDGDTISKRSAVRVSGFLVAPDQPATYTAQISITSSRSGNRMIPLTLEVR